MMILSGVASFSTSRRRLMVCACVGVWLGGAPGVWAQDAATVGDPAVGAGAEVLLKAASAVDSEIAPEVAAQSLCLNGLLGDVSAVRRATLQGPVWVFEPEAGRELVVLPIAIDAQVSGLTLDAPAFSVQSARFVGWLLPDAAQAARGDSGERVPTDAELLDLDRLLAAPEGEAAAMNKDDEPASPDQVLPQGAPLVARSLELLPGGRVGWMASRSLPGRVQASANPPTPLDGYRLKLDPEQVRAMKPERPARLARNTGEDRRAYDLRVRAANEVFRSQSTGFRGMTSAVRALPDRFEMKRPAVVGAVFEVNASGDLVVRGHAAGRWPVPRDVLASLGRMASARGATRSRGRGQTPGLTAEQAADVRLLGLVAGHDHPWSARAAAQALAGSGYLALAGPGADDAVGAVAQRLLASQDPVVRNRTVYALTRLASPTPGVVALLAQASSGGAGPAVDAVAVRMYLAMEMAGEAGDQAGQGRGGSTEDPAAAAARRVAAAANQMLQAADGPDAGAVVREVLAAAAADGLDSAALIDAVRFAGLPADRFAVAAAAVVDSASLNPAVAGGWLNRHLLGSADRGQVEQTLDLLHAVSAAAAQDPTAQDSDAGMSLPLDSGHALLGVLNSADATLRQKGWQALRCFVLPQGRSRGGEDAVDDDPAKVLDVVLNAALATAATPETLVAFLVGQSDRDPVGAAVTRALVRVIAQGDARSGQRAAQALLGSKRRVAAALDELDADGRGRFAARLYDRLEQGLMPVTGLIRAEDSTLTRFLEKEMAEGRTPDALAWAKAAGREATLFDHATGSDDALARGAIAALAAVAGGDTAHQLAAASALDARRGAMSPAEFGEAWAQVRQVIFTARLAQAAGEYDLVVVLRGRRPATADGGGLVSDPVLGTDPAVVVGNTDAQGADAPEQTHTLGVVELIADGGTVRLKGGTPEITVPDDRLAIRLPSPGDLKDLEVDALQDLPLERIEGPLDLLPDGQGGWGGGADLVDGRHFELRLEPRGQ